MGILSQPDKVQVNMPAYECDQCGKHGLVKDAIVTTVTVRAPPATPTLPTPGKPHQPNLPPRPETYYHCSQPCKSAWWNGAPKPVQSVPIPAKQTIVEPSTKKKGK